ncbi:cullin-associated NEDD8-dissociated protein 1 [Striga asiatica]|uniref:Cullin-associated NEDD8-dissociated protein 1 n=1 Tax=Striga asiatica TaxID=4170 RepID=A0A5A7QZ81_STRAF|nr:cullin-associated NEDD8-dissociated protein 1 [Striga asiatica]
MLSGTDIISMPFTNAYEPELFRERFHSEGTCGERSTEVAEQGKWAGLDREQVLKSFEAIVLGRVEVKAEDFRARAHSECGTRLLDNNLPLAAEVVEWPFICIIEADFGFVMSPTHSRPLGAGKMPVEPQLIDTSPVKREVGNGTFEYDVDVGLRLRKKRCMIGAFEMEYLLRWTFVDHAFLYSKRYSIVF